MQRGKEKNKIVSSTEFYDLIAGDYDDQMDDNSLHVRKLVAETLSSYIDQGLVLDFGGGTGQDLSWLQEKYRVIFLEPSENMRCIAKKKFPSANILFLEENIDFNSWSTGNLPFSEKPDAIIMNMAVFNCIPNPGRLIDKLDLVTKPGSLLIATILRHSVIFHLKKGEWKKAVLSFFRKIYAYSNYNSFAHKAYLHTTREIRNILGNSFRVQTMRPITSSPYVLMVAKKIKV